MSTANAQAYSLAIPAAEMQQMYWLAEVLPGEAAQTFARLMLGRGLGMNPAESLAQIDWVKGKPEMSANGQIARMRSWRGPEGQRYDYEQQQLDDDGCILNFVRIWPDGTKEMLGESKFMRHHAEQAELTEPSRNGASSMYTKYPRNMYFSRSVSNGVAWYAPETTHGARVYSPGEVDPTRPIPVPELPETAAGAAPATQALPAAPELPESARRAAEHFEAARQANPTNTQWQQQAPVAAAAPAGRASKAEYTELKDTAAARGLSDEQLNEILTGVGVPQVDGQAGRERLRARLKLATGEQVRSAVSRAAFTDADADDDGPADDPVQDSIPGTATELPAGPVEGVTGP